VDSLVANRLRENLETRRRRNPAYSLRAMARDLGLSHSYVSLLMRGRRTPSFARLVSIGDRLGWKRDELTSMASVDVTRSQRRPAGDRFKNQGRDQHKVLSDWYFLPILDLTTIEGFQPSARWISSQLGITLSETQAALRALTRLGLLRETSGKWEKTDRKLMFPSRKPMKSVRNYHRKMIKRGIEAMRSTGADAYSRRDITGITFAANPARLEAGKKKIQRFRRSLQAFLSQGSCTELYQLNVQLFPLTQSPKKKKRGLR
jgi:uncharacterized protein (TIGR02147 family)